MPKQALPELVLVPDAEVYVGCAQFEGCPIVQVVFPTPPFGEAERKTAKKKAKKTAKRKA